MPQSDNMCCMHNEPEDNMQLPINYPAQYISVIAPNC